MKLIQSNPYLRDPVKRRSMLEENARQSSILEGARLPALGKASMTMEEIQVEVEASRAERRARKSRR